MRPYGPRGVVTDLLRHRAFLRDAVQQLQLHDALGHARGEGRVDHEPHGRIGDLIGPARLARVMVGRARGLRAVRAGAEEPVSAHHLVPGTEDSHLVDGLPVHPPGRPRAFLASSRVTGPFRCQLAEVGAHAVAGILRR